MNTPIEVNTVGHVLRLAINAPHKRNALTPEMLCRLAAPMRAKARVPSSKNASPATKDGDAGAALRALRQPPLNTITPGSAAPRVRS